jgi:hypothetical protein
MVIHTIGDSHSMFGWNKELVKIHHLGGRLCFSVGRDGIDIKSNYDIINGDTVIFCFGEIDCRCHVQKHMTETITYKQVIDDIVNKYFISVKKAADGFENLRTVIYNVVPPVQKYNTHENPEVPYLGTDDERQTYVLYFNTKLRQKCSEYGFIFFDIYHKYTDTNGYLSKLLSDGCVHIKNGTYLDQFILQNFM